MKKILPILCFLVLSLNIFGQNQKTALDEVLGKTDALIELEDYDGAKELLNVSLEQFKAAADWSNYFEIVLELLKLTDDLNEGVKFMDSQIQLALEKIGNSNNQIAEMYHQYGTLFYNNYREDKAIEKYKSALDTRKKVLEFPHIDLARTNFMIGICNSYLGYYYEGIKHLKEAKQNYIGIENSDKENKCNSQLAENYSVLGEYQIAEGFYQSVIEYSIKAHGSNAPETAFYYNKSGEMFYHQKKYILSKKQFLIANDIYSLHKGYENKKIYFFKYLGDIFLKESKLLKALESYRNAASILERKNAKDSLSLSFIYENIGIVYKHLKNYDKTQSWLKKALVIRIQLFEKVKSLHLNGSYHNLGDLFLEQGDYEKALIYLQKAIQQQVLNFNNNDVFINPSLSEMDLLLGAKHEVLKDLKFKGLALKEGYRQSGKTKYLEAAKSTFTLATLLIEQMRMEFLGSGTKSFWLNETFPIFENVIDIYWQTYQIQPSEELFTEIIGFMEQNKAYFY